MVLKFRKSYFSILRKKNRISKKTIKCNKMRISFVRDKYPLRNSKYIVNDEIKSFWMVFKIALFVYKQFYIVQLKQTHGMVFYTSWFFHFVQSKMRTFIEKSPYNCIIWCLQIPTIYTCVYILLLIYMENFYFRPYIRNRYG